MDYRRMKLISYRKGYDFGDCAWGSRRRQACDFRTLAARRVRKQIKAMDRKSEPEWESEWIADSMDQGPPAPPYFNWVAGERVERFWEEVDEL